MNLTRRGWVALAATLPLASQVVSNPQAAQPPPAAPPVTSEQRAAKAADDVRKVSERLAQTEVPMQVEPAFLFRA